MSPAKELRKRREISARTIAVKEWADEEGNPFVLYCRPITCADLNALQKKHPDVLVNPSIASMVDLIVMKASGEDGERIFTAYDDRVELMAEETTVISEIANQMFGTIESVEDLEKN